MKNLYAMTEPGTTPGYLSVNQTEGGRIVVTVRSSGKDDKVGPQAEIGLTRQQAQALASALGPLSRGD